MGSTQSKPDHGLNIGGCILKIVVGLIQESKEEAIVNSTNEICDFNQNPSAKAIAEAAGPGLIEECRKFGKLVHGQVRPSDGYQLSCKKVLHLWIGQLDNESTSEKEFANIITECLCFIDQDLKLRSAAFTAIGTGVLRFPADFVARCFIKSVKIFISHNNVNCLKEINIKIPPTDETTHQKFVAVFEDHRKYVKTHFMEESAESQELLRTLDKESEEYVSVQSTFERSIGKKVTVLEIKQVHNNFLWETYKKRRNKVAKTLEKSKNDVEKYLYHGTPTDIAQEIASDGFNRSYAGKNETAFGKGCYFARDAAYSDNVRYSPPNNAGEKTIIRARVIVGEYTKGDKDMVDTPRKPDKNKYDSLVNDVQNPSIFVVFPDSSVYPEYIIKYK